MQTLAGVLAMLGTYAIVCVILSVIFWLPFAIILFKVAKKYGNPKPFFAFIPICTLPYYSSMVSWKLAVPSAILEIAIALLSGTTQWTYFVVASLLFYVTFAITTFSMMQGELRYKVLSCLFPPVTWVFLYKIYLSKKEI